MHFAQINQQLVHYQL